MFSTINIFYFFKIYKNVILIFFQNFWIKLIDLKWTKNLDRVLLPNLIYLLYNKNKLNKKFKISQKNHLRYTPRSIKI